MIGMLAGIGAPDRFKAHVMIGPSPCYVNDGDYVGGFARADIDSLLETMESNYLAGPATWRRDHGKRQQPELAVELTEQLLPHRPRHRPSLRARHLPVGSPRDVAKLAAPTLIVQCHDDLIAPRSVGEFLARTLPSGTLRVIDNVGHCPHLSSPGACASAMDDFFATSGA